MVYKLVFINAAKVIVSVIMESGLKICPKYPDFRDQKAVLLDLHLEIRAKKRRLSGKKTSLWGKYLDKTSG